jgi:hypothetical protein
MLTERINHPSIDKGGRLNNMPGRSGKLLERAAAFLPIYGQERGLKVFAI